MICFACRRRLSATALHPVPSRARAPRLPPQWQSRANASSASAGFSESDHANGNYVPSIDAPELENTRTPGRNQDIQVDVASSEPRFSAMHRRRLMRIQGDGSQDNDSLKLFEKVVRSQIEQDDSAAGSPPTSPVSLEFYNNLARLRPMMQTESLETCLEFFFTKLWDACPFEGRNRLLKQRGTYLMRRVVEAKMSDFDNERLPSVSRCMQIFHELDALSSTKWADAVMGLILAVDSRGKAEEEFPSAEAHKKALARKELLLHDLVDSWVTFHRHCLLPNQSAFRFPRLNEKRLFECARNRDMRRALRLMFPQLINNNVKELPAVAIASFVALSDPLHTSLDIQQKAKPLLEPLGKILAIIPIWKDGLQDIFKDNPDVLAYVLKRWDSVVSQLRQTNGLENVDSGTEHITREKVYTQRVGPDRKLVEKQVTAALKMGDVEAIEAAWRQLWGTEARPDDDLARELQGNQELFHYFIMAFTALHRPQRSVGVWDSMVSIGIKPTLKTWTALMEGCRRSKNAVGLENVWKKLRATGTELDDGVWSARIVGLVDCGQPEAGLRALDEMLRLSKLKPDDPTVSKLTRKIVSVNAAVAALIRLNAMSAAMKVLSWAAENGIEPDLFTYNTLLRPMVQQGNIQNVDSLLKMMKAQGLQPDAGTFTVLLDGLIGSTKGASPEEQVQMVSRLFSDMEAAGVRANTDMLARMMHLLFRESGSDASAAVDAIREFIREKGMRASPYIYTILVDHYFSQDPPDLAAVDALMEEGGLTTEDGSLRLQAIEQGQFDRVFWERMIKGYATAGHVDKAHGLFAQVNNLGSALTMSTLEILLRALVRAGRDDEARAMVETVLLHRQKSDVYGTADAGAGAGMGASAEAEERGEGPRKLGRYWRHGFWGFASDCGLISPGRLRQLELGMHAAPPPDAEERAS